MGNDTEFELRKQVGALAKRLRLYYGPSQEVALERESIADVLDEMLELPA